jgi:hypothetical protein
MCGMVQQPEALTQREWLVRCRDGNDHLDVCSVEVNDGDVAVATADGSFVLSFDESHLPKFRRAFDAATAQAERDRLARRG